MARSLSLVPLAQLSLLAGQEHGRTIPLAVIEGTSFDHLVGAGKQRRRHGEAECFRRVEVYRQLELGALLDRQVRQLGPFGWLTVCASLRVRVHDRPLRRRLAPPEPVSSCDLIDGGLPK